MHRTRGALSFGEQVRRSREILAQGPETLPFEKSRRSVFTRNFFPDKYRVCKFLVLTVELFANLGLVALIVIWSHQYT